MATDYVDLGFYGINFLADKDGGFDLTAQRAYFTEILGRLTATGKLDDATKWSVSPIGEWAGVGDYYCYAVVIEHLVSGISSGRKWLFGMTGLCNTSPPRLSELNEVFSSSAGTYFDIAAGSVTWDGALFLHMIDDAGADDYDWNVASDFSAPSSNPDTATATFFPANALKGGAINYSLRQGEFAKQLLLFNHEVPFLAICGQNTATLAPSLVYAGELIEPLNSTDTNGSCVTCLTITPTTMAFAVANFSAFDEAGVPRDDFAIDSVDNFTLSNERNASEEFVKSNVLCYRSGYIKGNFDPELIFQAGSDEAHNGLRVQTTHGASIKLETQYLFPWPAGAPAPGYDWPQQAPYWPTRT